MRAALYAGVSDEEQVEGYILDTHERAFRACSGRKGWDIFQKYVDHAEGVVAAWEIATEEERRVMPQMRLDAVYIDMTTE